ncbi:hypothetical protein [Mesorhizobium sp. B2-1-3A]|uniref:hypothetical protein n=1 Tax=Mesorhizobium sp. B2-1-3A TaxID=2589971 RepID=UPI001129F25F|nr:hypothetical protein [Mesorhizobium sp. B2-1-3A]TPM89828.1 hypothetical protein FJ977_35185 [Mesorhizobium sp. B2-1-3A]
MVEAAIPAYAWTANIDPNPHMKWLRPAIRAALEAALSVPAPGTDKWLGELLAVIHRDGGQYQATHGDEKAVEDAHSILVAAFSTPPAGDMGAVKVKPLTFEKQNVDGTLWCSNAAVAGMYRVKFVDEEWLTLRNDVIIGRSASSVAGMAIAQEHSTSRILSALSSTPVGEMDAATEADIYDQAATLAVPARDGTYYQGVEAYRLQLVLKAALVRASPQGGR